MPLVWFYDWAGFGRLGLEGLPLLYWVCLDGIGRLGFGKVGLWYIGLLSGWVRQVGFWQVWVGLERLGLEMDFGRCVWGLEGWVGKVVFGRLCRVDWVWKGWVWKGWVWKGWIWQVVFGGLDFERLGLAGWVWALLSRRWRRRRTRTERTGSWRAPARRPAQSWMRLRRTRPAPPLLPQRRRASGPGTTGSAAAAPPRGKIKWGSIVQGLERTEVIKNLELKARKRI